MGKIIMNGLFPLLIIVGGLAIGAWFFINPDEAEKKTAPEAQPLLIETGAPDTGTYPVTVTAMGQIKPARQITLRSQVSGEITGQSDEFIPGGYVEKGEDILTIDPSEYKLAVKKQEAILQQAKAAYDLEMGRQSIAKDELKIIEKTTGRKPESPDLALRKPQLAQAKAELEKARIDLDLAKLNLERTNIKAPFNALITERFAIGGDKIPANQELATLVGTDEYWAEVSIPVDDLKWIQVPSPETPEGSPARIILDGNRGQREGHVLRLTGTLDTASRLATVLVSIPAPLSGQNAENTPLILEDYVRVLLRGTMLENIIRIPLTWVRDGDIVWLKKDGHLIYNPVEILYEDEKYAYIDKGLPADSEIVTSDISVPVENMKIRTKEEARSDVLEKMHSSKGLE